MQNEDMIPRLILPKRYEILAREAKKQSVDIARIVQRVDDAADRLENLLRQVAEGGAGRFEFFLGKSGSGKTTFLRTLSKFFAGMRIREISEGTPTLEMPDQIEANWLPGEQTTVWVVSEKDNPEFNEIEGRRLFEKLRILFRKEEGQVVLIWPITDKKAANLLAGIAWEVGGDSITDLSKGIYDFKGVPKERYYDVADLTTRSLNSGRGLETFGLTRKRSQESQARSDTIGEFYSNLEQECNRINDRYRDILREKILPAVWILVAGDDSKDLTSTVATLTQGIDKKVDVDRLSEYLVSPKLDAAYLKNWRKRREDMAYLMRLLDVRLFELPPNVALTAVRAFGEDRIRNSLNVKRAGRSDSISSLQKARFFRSLIDSDAPRPAALRATDKKMADEYMRLQQHAAKQDKDLNKALAVALQAALAESKVEAEVVAERSSAGTNLKPDILVKMPGGRHVCLEVTWRTTGRAVEGEMKARQRTSTVGHIQQYLLEKILQYVNDLEL